LQDTAITKEENIQKELISKALEFAQAL